MLDLVPILVPIACGCILPIMIVWFTIRNEMNETNNRTQIVLAAIEKNPDMDIEELMKKISPKKKLLKEKLLSKLLWGSLTTLLGIGLIGCHFYVGITTDSTTPCGFFGIILLAVGTRLFCLCLPTCLFSLSTCKQVFFSGSPRTPVPLLPLPSPC